MADDIPDRLAEVILAALARWERGSHLHHSACIHNLPPEEQLAMRGRTVEWWTTVVGPLPEQITPDQWEIEPPNLTGRTG